MGIKAFGVYIIAAAIFSYFVWRRTAAYSAYRRIRVRTAVIALFFTPGITGPIAAPVVAPAWFALLSGFTGIHGDFMVWNAALLVCGFSLGRGVSEAIEGGPRSQPSYAPAVAAGFILVFIWTTISRSHNGPLVLLIEAILVGLVIGVFRREGQAEDFREFLYALAGHGVIAVFYAFHGGFLLHTDVAGLLMYVLPSCIGVGIPGLLVGYTVGGSVRRRLWGAMDTPAGGRA